MVGEKTVETAIIPCKLFFVLRNLHCSSSHLKLITFFYDILICVSFSGTTIQNLVMFFPPRFIQSHSVEMYAVEMSKAFTFCFHICLSVTMRPRWSLPLLPRASCRWDHHQVELPSIQVNKCQLSLSKNDTFNCLLQLWSISCSILHYTLFSFMMSTFYQRWFSGAKRSWHVGLDTESEHVWSAVFQQITRI